MNDDAILQRAREAGIAVDWIDSYGEPQRVPTGTLSRILEALGPAKPDKVPPLVTGAVSEPIDLAHDGAAELVLEDGTRQSLIMQGRLPPIATAGYHTLRFAGREVTLAVAPARCFGLADAAPGRKLWGIAVQLYSLRRAGDGGIGDTTALATLAQKAARHGADALALSPTHSLFPGDPARFGPYSPSSRLFLNPLLVDPAAMLGAQAAADALDEQPLIDWKSSGERKFAQLRRLFEDFNARRTPLADRFDAFVRDEGRSLEGHAAFEARNGDDPRFFAFLQWLADGAFASVQKTAKNAGMKIGLITDLAIGLDPGGAEVGADPQSFLGTLRIGAPPDLFNPKGQNWGLTSFSPRALVASGFTPFIATLRANMRHAGGIRIDHAMGLTRLWLIPDGAPPSDGAYVAYPVDDLLRLLALESQRHRAIVIGEDLGTLPPGFRERCRAAGIAGMDVLWFQRDGERFLSPSEWRDDAVAMTTTHDLPTVAGWWRGADLELRRGLGTIEPPEIERRPEERRALWRAFEEAGAAHGTPPAPEATDAVVDAAIDFIARAPGPLALVPLEDAMGVAEQPNLPGTIDEHPNWRRRFTLAADQLLRQPAAARRLHLLKERRS